MLQHFCTPVDLRVYMKPGREGRGLKLPLGSGIIPVNCPHPKWAPPLGQSWLHPWLLMKIYVSTFLVLALRVVQVRHSSETFYFFNITLVIVYRSSWYYYAMSTNSKCLDTSCISEFHVSCTHQTMYRYYICLYLFQHLVCITNTKLVHEGIVEFCIYSPSSSLP